MILATYAPELAIGAFFCTLLVVGLVTGFLLVKKIIRERKYWFGICMAFVAAGLFWGPYYLVDGVTSSSATSTLVFTSVRVLTEPGGVGINLQYKSLYSTSSGVVYTDTESSSVPAYNLHERYSCSVQMHSILEGNELLSCSKPGAPYPLAHNLIWWSGMLFVILGVAYFVHWKRKAARTPMPRPAPGT